MRHFPLFAPTAVPAAVLGAVLATVCIAGVVLPGPATADTVVRVTITNVVKPGGMLLAGAYDSPGTWLGATTVVSRDVPVAGNVHNGTVVFDMALPPGTYALSVFQDMNGNRKLDTNFLGIPTEASGSSNDAPAKWSAPKFKDAVFTVGNEPVELRITLK
ncbi:MAG: DUF2141 domain-containing protein [Chromatiales bacterium]|nr:DUF2141 domain-containing protein [Chromatiales bacterium]